MNGIFRQYSMVLRPFTADQRYRRKSQLSFTFFSTIVHKREILDNRVHFSTVNNNSRLSLTLSLTIVYVSHILYASLDYCLHFSIYFCPVWLTILMFDWWRYVKEGRLLVMIQESVTFFKCIWNRHWE